MLYSVKQSHLILAVMLCAAASTGCHRALNYELETSSGKLKGRYSQEIDDVSLEVEGFVLYEGSGRFLLYTTFNNESDQDAIIHSGTILSYEHEIKADKPRNGDPKWRTAKPGESIEIIFLFDLMSEAGGIAVDVLDEELKLIWDVEINSKKHKLEFDMKRVDRGPSD